MFPSISLLFFPYINIDYSLISVLSLSSALVSHLFGVFPTHGFSGDSAFPLTYNLAEVTLDNTDCRQQGELFCSPTPTPPPPPPSRQGSCSACSERKGEENRHFVLKLLVLLLKTTIFYPFIPSNSLQDVEPCLRTSCVTTPPRWTS